MKISPHFGIRRLDGYLNLKHSLASFQFNECLLFAGAKEAVELLKFEVNFNQKGYSELLLSSSCVDENKQRRMNRPSAW